MSERSGLLLRQGDALWDYLDSLLSEATGFREAASESPRRVAERAPAVAPVSAPGEKPAAEPVPEAAGVRAEAIPSDPPAEGVAPEWACPDFQALLFHVGRLKLAVPLIKLHGVLPWSDQISSMPNQPGWCHGVFRYRERNVTVIDTATLVLPEGRRADIEDEPAEGGRILIVGDGSWGLACRTVGEVIRLTPDEVKWRGRAATRPWLAGTVLGRLCALMDTEAFADMLQQGRAAAAARRTAARTVRH